MVNDSLMEEWEEFQRFENFQKMQPPKPEPKPVVDPYRTYTHGPQGQLITDWGAFGRNYTPEQLEIHSTIEDTRDIRDPEQLWNEILARRNGAIQAQKEFPDEAVFGK